MKTAPSPSDRENWLAILEVAAAKLEDWSNEDWKSLLAGLGLPLEDYPSLILTLEQGRWRNAKDPRAYVKTVARRLAARQKAMECSKIPEFVPQSKVDGVSSEDLLGHLAFVSETDGPVRGADGVWRRSGENELAEYENYDEDSNGNPLSLRGRLWRKLPLSLIKDGLAGDVEDFSEDWPPSLENVDLEKWAELAGFDEWEKRVLHYQAKEISRDRALAAQPDDASRRAVQAAWRRFDRSGKRRLQEVAKKLSQ